MNVAAPDLETSGADYASRFAGRAGRWLLDAQADAIRRALEGVRPGTALDVGGAHGQLVGDFTRRGWRVTVHGSDPQCEINLRTLHRQRDCEFLLGDPAALPVADRAYDLVMSVRLLSHVADWRGQIAEMCRVARRAILFDFPCTSGFNALTPLLFGLKRSMEGNTRTYRSFGVAELRAECARHGYGEARIVRQLCLPMVVHRVGRGAAVLRGAEHALRAIGLTALIGSPAILCATRTDGAAS